MEKIVLSGKPISTQNAYGHGNGRRYLKPEARERKEQYAWEAKSQWKKKPLTKEIAVDVVLYFNDNRRRDWDNWHKISMDALEGIVYEDDSQIQDAHVMIAKGEPRIEIYIL